MSRFQRGKRTFFIRFFFFLFFLNLFVKTMRLDACKQTEEELKDTENTVREREREITSLNSRKIA